MCSEYIQEQQKSGCVHEARLGVKSDLGMDRAVSHVGQVQGLPVLTICQPLD